MVQNIRKVNNFNEVTRIARKSFDRITSCGFHEEFDLDLIAQMKYKSIKKAIEAFGHDYHLNSYIVDFYRRKEMVKNNYYIQQWCELIGALDVIDNVAQHIVFEGQSFMEKVLFKDLLEKDKLEIPFHAEWKCPIFKDKLDGKLVQPKQLPAPARFQPQAAAM